MKEEICRNCKHWQEHEYERYKKFGDCKKMIYDSAWDKENKTIVYYMDGESYSATVYVGEKFGCIHWESK